MDVLTSRQLKPICPACDRPMRGHSCVGPSHVYACGSEPFWSTGEYGFPVRCSDCGAPPGGNHHPGCLNAECALGCEDQARFCAHSQEPPPVREQVFGPHIH